MKKNLNISIQSESSALRVKVSTEFEFILLALQIFLIIAVLKNVLFELGRRVIVEILRQLDDKWLKEKDWSIKVCRFVNRTIKTSLGEITFRYRQAKCGGKYFSPLLETLGIKHHQRFSDDAISDALTASIYTSFRKALKITSPPFSLSTLWKAAQKEGQLYRDKAGKAIYYCLEGEPAANYSPLDFAVVIIDEIWIRAKRSGRG